MKHIARNLVALVVVLVPASVRANPAALAFSAANGCPSREAFVSSVERRGGSFDEPATTTPTRTFSVVLRRESGGYSGTLAVDVGSGEGPEQRQIQGTTCDEVAEALSIAIALELHPDSESKTKTSPIELSATTPEPPPADATTTKPAAVAFRGRSNWGRGASPVAQGELRLEPKFAVTLSGGASLGLLPWLSSRYDLTFRMASFMTLPNGEQQIIGPILRARLGFSGSPQRAYETKAARITISGQSAGLGVCWSPLYDSAGLVLLGCGELGLAGYSTRVTETAGPTHDSTIAMLGTVGPIIEAEYNFGPLQLSAKLGGNLVFGSLEAQRTDGERLFKSRGWESFLAIGAGGHW